MRVLSLRDRRACTFPIRISSVAATSSSVRRRSRCTSTARRTPRDAPVFGPNWYATSLWTEFGLEVHRRGIAKADKPFFLYLATSTRRIFRCMAPAESDIDQLPRQVHGRLGQPAGRALPPATRDGTDRRRLAAVARGRRKSPDVGIAVKDERKGPLRSSHGRLCRDGRSASIPASARSSTASARREAPSTTRSSCSCRITALTPSQVRTAASNGEPARWTATRTFISGMNWAALASTPFRRFKHFTHEGGHRRRRSSCTGPRGIPANRRNGPRASARPRHRRHADASSTSTGATYPSRVQRTAQFSRWKASACSPRSSGSRSVARSRSSGSTKATAPSAGQVEARVHVSR